MPSPDQAVLRRYPGSDRRVEHEVREEIRRLFDSRSLRAEKYGPLFASLWKTAAQCVMGGKLLRPRLLLEAFDALCPAGGQSEPLRAAAVRIAAATELLHYSFLLHDDVIDGDVLRRGRPNLVGAVLAERGSRRPATWRAMSADDHDVHWARTSGILMGDMLLSDAHHAFAREPLPEPVRIRLLDLLDHAITESIVGEHLDVALGDGVITPDLETVLSMTRLKTATYTFELPLKAAAIVAGASRRTEDALGRVAGHLGVVFQLQDDLLSAFGDAAEHGKDALSDLREGKETAIIAFARTTESWRTIERFLGDPGLSPSDAMTVRRHLTDCGAEAFVGSLVAEHLRAARWLLVSPDSAVPPGLAGFLHRTMQKLETRRS
ncbi:polyprenyl synthetase family protein [Microbacterium sp. No. 7]|uniref:polyprenyl synthetase family protein n=1 Tax=Microbacterium sp. No. 7 TaxID=1714373 RepID=UPI0006ECDD61|nr:polyprenyl synthetase family protein [Microbacterium sp. No. 7]ALJ18444.1 hypothetical protein AOA12_00325 [Microbacterium sp. No. 7]